MVTDYNGNPVGKTSSSTHADNADFFTYQVLIFISH